MNSIVADPREQRALAITLFHALRHELTGIDDELGPEAARALLSRALNYLPGVEVEATERVNILKLHREGAAPVDLNVQDAIDSLRLVWREYMRLEERAAQETERKK